MAAKFLASAGSPDRGRTESFRRALWHRAWAGRDFAARQAGGHSQSARCVGTQLWSGACARRPGNPGFAAQQVCVGQHLAQRARSLDALWFYPPRHGKIVGRRSNRASRHQSGGCRCGLRSSSVAAINKKSSSPNSLQPCPCLDVVRQHARCATWGPKPKSFSCLRELTKSGASVLFYSTDSEEFINMCDRILVMRQGQIQAELSAGTMTEENLVRASLGEPLAGETVAAADTCPAQLLVGAE